MHEIALAPSDDDSGQTVELEQEISVLKALAIVEGHAVVHAHLHCVSPCEADQAVPAIAPAVAGGPCALVVKDDRRIHLTVVPDKPSYTAFKVGGDDNIDVLRLSQTFLSTQNRKYCLQW